LVLTSCWRPLMKASWIATRTAQLQADANGVQMGRLNSALVGAFGHQI
jgi:hypothetical protein